MYTTDRDYIFMTVAVLDYKIVLINPTQQSFRHIDEVKQHVWNEAISISLMTKFAAHDGELSRNIHV